MKKETKIIIAFAFVLIIGLVVYNFMKAKKNSEASRSFVDYVQGNVEYPEKRDLAGFDQGEILNYKGNKFKANVSAGTWDLI